jgi:hypothetical protein
MAKRICPHCYTPFELKDILFRCSNPDCVSRRDDRLSELLGEDRILHPVVPAKKKLFGAPEFGICPECHQKTYKMICPHCHSQVPPHMVKDGGKIISIIGAQSAGKTVFVSVLIEELRRYVRKLHNDLGVMPSAIADTVEESTQYRYNEELYGPIYRDKMTPQPTERREGKKRPPFIFEMTQKNQPSVFLVFYDNAGESFHSVVDMGPDAKYLVHSDAFICLIDVMQIEEVRNKLNISDATFKMHNPDFGFVPNNIIQYCQNDAGLANANILRKPMAIVFNKFDRIYNNASVFNMQDVPGIGKNRTDSYFKQKGANGVKRSDFDQVHDGILEFLKEECGPVSDNFISNINNGFENYKFFGTSPLGDEPVDGAIGNLNPFRVLDPLVWCLDELGYKLNIVD